LPKFAKANKDYSKLHKWLTFLSNPTGKETAEFMKTDGEIKEAMDYYISREPKSMSWCESLFFCCFKEEC